MPGEENEENEENEQGELLQALKENKQVLEKIATRLGEIYDLQKKIALKMGAIDRPLTLEEERDIFENG